MRTSAKPRPLWLRKAGVFFGAAVMWWSLHGLPMGEIGRTMIQFATCSHQSALEQQVAGLLRRHPETPRLSKAPDATLRAALPMPVHGNVRELVAISPAVEQSRLVDVKRFAFGRYNDELPAGLRSRPPHPPPKHVG